MASAMKPFQRVAVWNTVVKDGADTPAPRKSGQHRRIAPAISVTDPIDVVASVAAAMPPKSACARVEKSRAGNRT